MHFKAKKQLGQNFLVQKNIINRILTACQLKKDDIVVEIGPGKGAITEGISKTVKEVIAIEADRQLVKVLQERFKDSNVTIIHADILKYNFESLPKKFKLIGNLPYNISTPIIEKALSHRHQFDSFFMTVQYEFGQRLNAKPNTKSYGSFSCYVQFYANTKMLFKIPHTAFKPVPKVQSCFLELSIPTKQKYKVEDEPYLFKIIRNSFLHRRKLLLNSLSNIIEKELLKEWFIQQKINSKCRAEDLTIADFISLADFIRYHSNL